MTAGPLTAAVTAPPWHLTFRQQRGAGLDEAGSISVSTATGAFSATRATALRRHGRTVVVELATDDPAGRGLEVRIAPAGDGTIALRATVTGGATDDIAATSIGWRAPPTERYFGFGERSAAVDQRGRDVENDVSDGPFRSENAAVVSATVPPQGFRDRDDATYFPIPWLLSSRGYGFVLDNDETSTVHLATDSPTAWSVQARSPTLAFRVFAGPTPARALTRYTAATGRQPPPSAPWQFGPWFQTGQPNTVPLDQEADWLNKLQSADAPVSAAETQLRYLPCGLDRGNED